jgi:tryptophan halogenase
MKNFLVAGGGTAGWMVATMLASLYEDSKITVIENKDIGTIGVGESTTPVILDFLGLANINLIDFISKTESTIKVGINFENWTKQDVKYFHGNRNYLHSFDLSSDKDIWGISYLYDFLEDNHKYDHYVRDNLVPFTREGKQVGAHALHINAIKLVEYLKNFLNGKVTVKEGLITEVKVGDCGVTCVKFEDQTELTADVYFDCTGFKRVLHTQLGSQWNSLKDLLPVNRAMPCPFEWTAPMNTTHASALSAGWAWQVPLQSRVGSGYVYSEEFCKDPEEEFVNFIHTKYGKTIEPSRVIKFETGYIKNSWNKNVVCIGLSSGFVEPLESTSIHMIFHQIMSFSQVYDGTITPRLTNLYNSYMNDMYEDTASFIKLHYLGGRDDTEFWRYMNSAKNTPRLQNLLDLWKHHFPAADHIGQNKDRTVGYRLFAIPAWIQVLVGMNIIDKKLIRKYLEFNNIPNIPRPAEQLITQQDFLNNLLRVGAR